MPILMFKKRFWRYVLGKIEQHYACTDSAAASEIVDCCYVIREAIKDEWKKKNKS